MRASGRNAAHALAGVVAVGCVLWMAGCSSPPDHTDAVARNLVTFSVVGHGIADITWPGAPHGAAVHTTLPWHAAAHEPANANPLVLTVVLDGRGGTATCSISINGHPVGSSLAQGKFGRANCHTPAGPGSELQSND